jgi:nucleoside-diphosphate-sugar epimerase
MTAPRRILVTGANGFVGQALCEVLQEKGYPIRAAVRAFDSGIAPDQTSPTETVAVGSITAETDWTLPLSGVEAVVHLAGRAHVSGEAATDVLSLYREINVKATARLARMAAASGVTRFLFMSSVKVNGERTVDHPFTEHDTPWPEDAYGISKWEAEQALDSIAKETGMETIVLRPALVYGPRVKGNFLRLAQSIARRTPLPFASVSNRRSLVYVGNLIHAIVTCLETPVAAGKTYLVSDNEDVSTPELIRSLADALRVPERLFPFPVALLKLGGAMLGKRADIARLIGSLQVNSTRIHRDLGWRPRFSLLQGLEQTARWYREQRLGHD